LFSTDPRKDDVDRQNDFFLNQLAGDSRKYDAKDGSKMENSAYLNALQKNCPAPASVTLKVGAQVILLKNLDMEHELVNGSRGRVVGFQEDKETKMYLPYVEFDGGRRRIIRYEKWSTMVGADEVAWREQIPLRLAWSLSIHKSQGMTINRVEIGLGRIFEDGQAYVALSRATSLEGLKIQNQVDPKVIRANPKVLQFYRDLGSKDALLEASSQSSQY
jgi:ATP-dependent DNA helicase PIF1